MLAPSRLSALLPFLLLLRGTDAHALPRLAERGETHYVEVSRALGSSVNPQSGAIGDRAAGGCRGI